MLVGCGGGTAETFGSEAAGIGAPGVGGVTTDVIASLVCPLAGGCTVIVVVVPSLLTETTCCACPVFAASVLACSSAFSCFEAHPESAHATSATASHCPLPTKKLEFTILKSSTFVPLFRHIPTQA
jgi:hypothetical protein